MFNNLKNKSLNDKKIMILFTILFIFNIALFINLFNYIVTIDSSHIFMVDDIVTIVSTIIILGFISTRLPKLKEISDEPVYEISYLIIMGLLSLTISYFNISINGQSVWTPFLEMFKMLSVILILTYITTKSKSFKAIVDGDHSRKTILWQIIICSILGVLASYFTLDVNGVPANSRGLIVMISALLGGPYVGIPVGIISGLWRFSIGGPTALACSIATIITSIIGSLIYNWNGGKFLKSYNAAILMFLVSGLDMFIITILTPKPEGLLIANALYAPMTFAAVLGMLLFTLFLDEKEETKTKNKQTIKDNTSKTKNKELIKISQELQEYKNKVDNLERELNEIKNKL